MKFSRFNIFGKCTSSEKICSSDCVKYVNCKGGEYLIIVDEIINKWTWHRNNNCSAKCCNKIQSQLLCCTPLVLSDNNFTNHNKGGFSILNEYEQVCNNDLSARNREKYRGLIKLNRNAIHSQLLIKLFGQIVSSGYKRNYDSNTISAELFPLAQSDCSSKLLTAYEDPPDFSKQTSLIFWKSCLMNVDIHYDGIG